MRYLYLLLALLAGSVDVHADSVPVVPAGAGNRFELALTPPVMIATLTALKSEVFHHEVTQVGNYLRTLPAVTAPATASVYVGLPRAFDRSARACSPEMDAGLREGRLPWRSVERRAFLDNELAVAQQLVVEKERAAKDYAAMSKNLAALGVAPNPQGKQFQADAIALRKLIAVLRKEMGRKTDATWVCVDGDMLPTMSDRCGEDQKLVERDPAYWDQTRPERIQLLLASAAHQGAPDWQQLVKFVLP